MSFRRLMTAVDSES